MEGHLITADHELVTMATDLKEVAGWWLCLYAVSNHVWVTSSTTQVGQVAMEAAFVRGPFDLCM